MHRMRTPFALALGAALVVTAPSGAVLAAEVPPSLVIEYLNAFPFLLTADERPSFCNPQGDSTTTFTVHGTTQGPYPGTFTETVTVTIGAQVQSDPTTFDVTAGTVTRFDATFSIDSPVGQVRGSKTIDTSAPAGEGVCDSIPAGAAAPNVGLASVDAGAEFGASTAVRYQVTVTTEDGTFTDSGTGRAQFLFASYTGTRYDGTHISGAAAGFFEQFYTSTGMTAAGPASVVLEPAQATNTVGTTHTVTATVRTQAGAPAQGVPVRYSVSGSVTATGSCTTDPAGTCPFTYTGPAFPGADRIEAFVDVDTDGTRDPGEPAAEATKTWVLPATTPGHVTGGGRVPAPGGPATFGFNAKSDAKLDGTCTVVQPATGVNVKCLDVTAFTQSGTHATFYGHALVDGVAALYRIDVDDVGTSGAGEDRFSIVTSTGFSAGGTLIEGNVQAHG